MTIVYVNSLLSPEFYEKLETRYESDMYSFGIVMFELMTGLQNPDRSEQTVYDPAEPYLDACKLLLDLCRIGASARTIEFFTVKCLQSVFFFSFLYLTFTLIPYIYLYMYVSPSPCISLHLERILTKEETLTSFSRHPG